MTIVVLEAHEQQLLRRRLDRDRQARRADLALRVHVVANLLQRRHADMVFDDQFAKAARAVQFAAAAFDDRALVQVRHEQLGLLGMQHQPAPELFARHRVDQGIQRVVNFYQVYKFHRASTRWECRTGDGNACTPRLPFRFY